MVKLFAVAVSKFKSKFTRADNIIFNSCVFVQSVKCLDSISCVFFCVFLTLTGLYDSFPAAEQAVIYYPIPRGEARPAPLIVDLLTEVP